MERNKYMCAPLNYNYTLYAIYVKRVLTIEFPFVPFHPHAHTPQMTFFPVHEKYNNFVKVCFARVLYVSIFVYFHTPVTVFESFPHVWEKFKT